MTRFTPEEDQMILKAIKKNPTNLNLVFNTLSLALGRDASVISSRWYGVLRFVYPAFAIKGCPSNTKNIPQIVSSKLLTYYQQKLRQAQKLQKQATIAKNQAKTAGYTLKLKGII